MYFRLACLFKFHGIFQIYEEIRTIRVPKPGTKNPQVRLNVVDLQRPKVLKVKTLEPPAYYVKNKYDEIFKLL